MFSILNHIICLYFMLGLMWWKTKVTLNVWMRSWTQTFCVQKVKTKTFSVSLPFSATVLDSETSPNLSGSHVTWVRRCGPHYCCTERIIRKAISFIYESNIIKNQMSIFWIVNIDDSGRSEKITSNNSRHLELVLLRKLRQNIVNIISCCIYIYEIISIYFEDLVFIRQI